MVPRPLQKLGDNSKKDPLCPQAQAILTQQISFNLFQALRVLQKKEMGVL